MSPPLPPLQALRALEAASRRRSFSRAAEALHLTHSAISHHLRTLETQLGVKLFHRAGTRMIPTTVGTQLAERVRRSLAELHDALDAAQRGASGAIRLEVSTMADFSSLWLIPRLSDFYDQHPLDQEPVERLAASVLTRYPARWSIIRVPPQRAANARAA
jgi:DNA-binding transcriptional LysR family regulator